MGVFEWGSLMTEWNERLFRCHRVVDELPSEVRRSGWLGYPPATEEQIRSTEARLGVALPPSYREFLKVANGWRTLGRFTGQIWSTENVQWFRTRNQSAIDDWLLGALANGPAIIPDDEYLVYGGAQHSYNVRFEYLPSTLEVSEMVESQVYLLNPNVMTAEGEWEAWFLAPWLWGAERYRSFWDLMKGEFELFEC